MAGKYEWRKQEKAYYLPKAKPEVIELPAFQFLTISGEGDPNAPGFSKYIEALYSVSYAIKMTLKKMEAFAEAEGWARASKVHREIYLSDFRKVAPEKLKTVLRFKVL